MRHRCVWIVHWWKAVDVAASASWLSPCLVISNAFCLTGSSDFSRITKIQCRCTLHVLGGKHPFYSTSAEIMDVCGILRLRTLLHCIHAVHTRIYSNQKNIEGVIILDLHMALSSKLTHLRSYILRTIIILSSVTGTDPGGGGVRTPSPPRSSHDLAFLTLDPKLPPHFLRVHVDLSCPPPSKIKHLPLRRFITFL